MATDMGLEELPTTWQQSCDRQELPRTWQQKWDWTNYLLYMITDLRSRSGGINYYMTTDLGSGGITYYMTTDLRSGGIT